MSDIICDTNTVSTLPRKATHNDEICDKYGNHWKYDAGQDNWVSKGTISFPPYVTEEIDGLVDVETFKKLQQLKSFVDTRYDLNTLKILPGRDAYWYYFRTSDKMFRFKPEGDSALRIEVDKARIYQLLLKEICPGVKGPIGNKGSQGLDGDFGADEVCFSPSVVERDRIDFAVFTPTPLLNSETIVLPNNHVPEISIRLFIIDRPFGVGPLEVESQLQHLAVLFQPSTRRSIAVKFQATRELLQDKSLGIQIANQCDIALSPVVSVDNESTLSEVPSVTIEISPDSSTNTTITSSLLIDSNRTLNSIQFDPETNVVCGSIYLEAGNSWSDVADDWCIKSRQKGPDGSKGDPGECVFEIAECVIDDTNILANCPIINVRFDCDQNIIYTLCTDLIDEVSADFVDLLPNSTVLTTTDVLKSVFVSAQTTLEEYKFIHRFNVDLLIDEMPELRLLHWEPQPGCVTKRHYNRHKFNWIPGSDIPACDDIVKWWSPDSIRPGVYPDEIVMQPEPADSQCCQDDWFYCRNVQDAPCENEPPAV